MHKFFYYFYLVSLLLLFYLIGFFTFKYEFFPKSWLDGSINLSLKDLGESNRKAILSFFKKLSENKNSEEFQFTINRNTFKNEQIDYEGFLLISLSLDQFNNDNIGLYKNNREKVFSWSFDKTIKPKIALHLDQNGNILVYNDTHVSLISNKSNEIWRSKKVIHHWGTVFEGKLFIPGRKYLNYPEDLDEKSKKLNIGKCKVKNALADTILQINMENGTVEREIDLLPIISSHSELGKKLGYSKKIFSKLKTDRGDGFFESKFLGPSYCDDLTHLNDIKILKKDDLKYFKNSKEGDFLLSLHTIDSIVLVDHESLEIKWHLRKNFKRQHSPNITNDGNLIVFDNKGGDEKYGKSRIVKFDLKNNKFHSFFDGNNSFFFESLIRGRIQLINNDIYVTSSQQGEVFKLNCDSEFLEECSASLLFSSFDGDKPNSIFVGDFYSTNYFTKEFLTRIAGK